MKVGVIFAAWQCADLLEASLTPWVEAKRARLAGHDFTICAVSVPFEGFPQEEVLDNTRYKLGALANYGEIDHVVVSDKPMKETEARGRALQWLVAQGVDMLWQVDADEVYTADDIAHILTIVERNGFMAWWRLSLRNAVFDEHTFLIDPFTPPRIHKVNLNRFRAAGFWDDNNVLYRATDDGTEIQDTQWASFTVPPNVAFVRHLSWLSNERSRRKVAYQQAHFGHCGYRWDEQRGLCFNEAFYAKHGLPLPEVVHE